MSPAAKFHGLVSTVTVFLMYVAMTRIWPMLNALVSDSTIAGGIAASLAAFGTYRLLASILTWLLQKSVWLRSKILGARFMHGTWVGYFVGYAGDKRFVVERFEQSLEGLCISGRSFTEAVEAHAQWSTEAATIDSERGRLFYSYTCDVLTRPSTEQGVGVFLFERTSADAAPKSFQGYVADLADGRRKSVEQVKISDNLLPWPEAVAQAKKKFSP